MPPAVFVIATPIANLDDVSVRALNTLKSADIIAAEDTRHIRKLLTHFDITKKELISYQDHGEDERAVQLIKRIVANDETLALVTDAGTPCIADPGYRLVRRAKEAGIAVHPVPGPSALITLVSAAGLPSDRFTFVGFLPTKSGALQEEMEGWPRLGGCVVFYETARRLLVTLQTLQKIHPQAEVAVGRELTKLYEEIVTCPIAGAVSWAEQHKSLRGEAVVMVHLSTQPQSDALVTPEVLIKKARREFRQGASLKDLLRAYEGFGYSRKELYHLLLTAKGED